MSAQLPPEQLRALCREMDAEVRALVAAQSAGNLDREGFVNGLLHLEAEKAQANGLVLTASHTFDEWTVVSLRVCGSAHPCVCVEFHPATGCFRKVGTACREADPRRAACAKR